MTDAIDSLPWSSLSLQTEEIPWADLRTLADAAVQSREVRQRLLDELKRAIEARWADEEETGAAHDLSDLAIPAVFALAADRLDPQARQKTAGELVRVICEAGQHDDEFLLELLPEALKPLGSAVVGPALDLIERYGIEMACFYYLMPLLGLSRDDPALRQRAINVCRRLIRKTDYYDDCWTPLAAPAHILADLGDRESLPTLRELYARSDCSDIRDAIRRLKSGHRPAEYSLQSQLTPVEQWLPEKVKEVRKYLAEGESEEFDDEWEEDPDQIENCGEITRAFCESPAFQELPPKIREHAGFAVQAFLNYMHSHLGCTLNRLTAYGVEDLMLDLLPQKVAADRDFFEAAPAALAKFLEWSQATGKLQNATRLVNAVYGCASTMLANSQNPDCWEMAKSLHMQAAREGVDPTDEKAMNAFIARYNAEQISHRQARTETFNTLRRINPKLGRNDPCPCGSGRKYKKCCGKGQ